MKDEYKGKGKGKCIATCEAESYGDWGSWSSPVEDEWYKDYSFGLENDESKERWIRAITREVEEENWDKLHIFFATSNGSVRRNALSDFSNVRANGKIAIKLQEGTSLVDVKTCSNNDDIMIATSRGKAIRFNVSDVRVFKGRDSSGVRGIKLAEDDKVVLCLSWKM